MKRKIERLNELLRQELGEQGGRYAWHHSESEELMRPMRVCDGDGSPVFRRREVESSELYGPDDKPLVAVVHEPVFTKRKTCLTADNQWVLCRLLPPALTRMQWERVFCGMQAYPENGEWAPCESHLGPISPPNKGEPTEKVTWEVIHAFRRQRAITAADMDNAVKEALDRRDYEKRGDVMDMLHDAKPAFANCPGMKGHVSFPTAAVKPKGQTNASSNN